MLKKKLFISRKKITLFLVLLALIIATLSFWLFEGLTVGVESAILPSEEDAVFSAFFLSRIISYATTCLFLLSFLISFLALNKHGYGYFFFITWIVLLGGGIFVFHFLSFSFENATRIALNSLISTFFAFLLLALSWQLVNLIKLRKLQRYEMVQNFKNRK